jgi:hypothetical protein
MGWRRGARLTVLEQQAAQAAAVLASHTAADAAAFLRDTLVPLYEKAGWPLCPRPDRRRAGVQGRVR